MATARPTRNGKLDHPEMGEALREARAARGLSLRELADRLGVSPSLISQIETGRANPSVSTLYAIVTELDVSLDEVFRESGAEWREPGCSMCIAMNGDRVDAGQYAVSTSNRNFEGRQGPGARTFLASPLTAAATAVTGVITDVRTLS